MNKTIISKGNSKIGKIPNVSSIPIKDCVNCSQCKKECYALKAFKQYPNVRKAWTNNSRLIREDLDTWQSDIRAYCTTKKPKFFRFNVAGDIISLKHFVAIKRIARACPNTKFLLFSKSYEFISSNSIPDNLSIVVSLFPNMKVPAKLKSLPRAYAGEAKKDYKGDKRALKALDCHGGCDTCGLCWELKNINRDVIFEKH